MGSSRCRFARKRAPTAMPPLILSDSGHVEAFKDHAELPAPLGHAAQLRGVTEQSVQGRVAVDDHCCILAVGIVNHCLAGLQITQHGAEVLLGYADLHCHYRAQQHPPCLGDRPAYRLCGNRP